MEFTIILSGKCHRLDQGHLIFRATGFPHPLLGVTALTVLESAGGSAKSADPGYTLTRGAKPASEKERSGSGDGKGSGVSQTRGQRQGSWSGHGLDNQNSPEI